MDSNLNCLMCGLENSLITPNLSFYRTLKILSNTRMLAMQDHLQTVFLESTMWSGTHSNYILKPPH